MEMNDNYKINFPQSVSTSIQAREEWDKMLKESNPFDTLSNYVKDIIERKDKETAFGFIKCIGKLLRKNGVVPLIEEYATGEIVKDDSTIEQKYRVAFTGLDFTEHDKKFNDEIESLKRQIEKLASIRTRCHESARDCFDSGNYGCLHIVTADELKNTKDNMQKINMNETIKVKLTPLGAEIYYKQFDDVNKQCGREICKPQMPRIDKDGYTEFQLWHFIELYGQHIGMCKPNVIEPLDIVYCKHNREVE